MKITIRIPTKQYAYQEVEYASLDEYIKEHKKVVEAFNKIDQELESTEMPF